MKLAKRERYFMWAGAGCLVLFLTVQFVVFPFFDKKERLENQLKTKQKDLDEIVRLRAEYATYEKGSQGIQRALSSRKKGFTLFSFLEEAAGAAEVKEHIKYMKPSSTSSTGPYKESTVEMKLEGITLEQLVKYLHRIESPEDLVNIKRITISRNKKEEGYLDAILQVLTFQQA
jgi:general secretion pathway protein M